MSLFRCPVCGAPLERESGAYRCPNRHSYDLAREGYTYLLPPNQKHSAAPGDDKEMSAARRAFLSKDYYRPLRDALCALAVSHTSQAPSILDAGCGEGYYTAGLWEALGRPPLAGMDMSKQSVRLAARRVPEGEFAVASAYHLPLADASVGLVLNCFSPLALDEFRRVLRPGGRMIYVVPGAEHLYQMKAVLYAEPYKNPVQEVAYEGFRPIGEREARGTITVPASQLEALFAMTPYYWKTPRDGAARLAALPELTTEIAFRFLVFEKL